MTLIQYLYISIIGLAFISSLISFRLDYSLPLKVFSILLGIDCIAEIMATYGMGFLPLKKNNSIYNVFMLIEFWLYVWFFYKLIKSKIAKGFALIFLICFPLFWYWAVFDLFGIHEWNSYVIVAGSVFSVFFSAIYCYQIFTSTDSIRLSKHSEFWIATGLIIFYSCNLPYTGMLNYLVEHHLELAKQLLVLLRVLNIVMYSIFTYAYLCPIAIRKD